MSDNNKMREVPPITDETYKALMAALGMPNNRSLLSALQQIANHATQRAAWQAAQSVPVVGEVVGYLAGGTLMRRKIHGYDCKPLIIRPKNSITTAELERMRKCEGALKQMLWIVHDSSGVAGYHLNGDIAEWESFPEYHAALAAIAAEGEK